MKGIVFNLLERVVSSEYGEDAWDQLLEQAGVEGAYTSLGGYPDEEFYRLIGAASRMLNPCPEDPARWFACGAMPLMAAKYPEFFLPHRSTRPFLLTLNDVIHPEVRKIYPGADVPVFDYDTSSTETLVMHYSSHRKLCSLALGFIEGATAHYREVLTFSHPACMKRGDPQCTFRLSFSPQ